MCTSKSLCYNNYERFMSYIFNFSHSLYTKTNCLLRTHYHLLMKELGLAPITNEAMERGTNLHKNVEQFLKDEPIIFATEEQETFFDKKVFPYARQIKREKIERIEAEFLHPLTKRTQAKGIMDLIYDNRIFDWKFTNSEWTGKKLAAYKENQALLYQFLYYNVTGKAPKNVTYWVFPIEGTFQEFIIPFNLDEVYRAVDTYRLVCQELEECCDKLDFQPNPSYFNCKYCDFNDICPVSQEKKQPLIKEIPIRKSWKKTS